MKHHWAHLFIAAPIIYVRIERYKNGVFAVCCAKTPQKLRGNLRYLLFIAKKHYLFKFANIVVLINQLEVKTIINFRKS